MIKHALATIERGAVGNHALGINEALSDVNIETTTFAETIRPEFLSSVKNIDALGLDLVPDDVVLYQFANPSPMADLLFERECRLIVNYHNITPAHYFARWFPATSGAISRARAQLARLAPIASAAIAVSEYNAAELVALGYKNVEIIPPIFSEAFYRQDKRDASQRDVDSWLFVGRIAPHKNIHVLIHAFEIYRRTHEGATLSIVGSCDTPLYGKAIDELIDERDLSSVVTIKSSVSIEELSEHYNHASVFVSASEHEGFCVPLIEAMACGLPVVAVSAAAVGDTCASAAVLMDVADPNEIADAVAELSADPSTMILKGYERAQKFNPAVTKEHYAQYLSRWI